MADHERIVDGERGVDAAEAVGLGGDRHVMESGEILDIDPGRPMGGEAAGDAQFAQLACRSLDLGPGLRSRGVVKSRGTEQILVVVKDRGR